MLNIISGWLIRSVEDIKVKLNDLNKIRVTRREEEITKFIIKKVVKFAQDGENNPSYLKEGDLYKSYFNDIMTVKEFDDLFYSSKQYVN